MSKPIIKVENLGKKYQIGEPEKYLSLRDQIGDFFKFKKNKKDEFWALKDINFEVNRGDTLGVIGRNGSGKSTLLKILSQITPPTTGKATMRGRVASLLEVGTGFHPELTGRENVFLNGAILGMSQNEIKKKFDEIVAFSEIEKFLDTPVKHYSSGMYVRLAFAVAAHLEPEILIVDEVLAVGDAQFQKKCLGKMSEVGKDGRTVLFVSHNISAIKSLCKNCLLLDNGTMLAAGETGSVSAKYLKKSIDNQMILQNYSSDYLDIIEFNTLNTNGEKENCFAIGDSININLKMKYRKDVKQTIIGFIVKDVNDELVAHIINLDDNFFIYEKNKDDSMDILISLDRMNFVPSEYYLSLWIGRSYIDKIFEIENALKFEIIQDQSFIKRSTKYPVLARTVVKSFWKAK